MTESSDIPQELSDREILIKLQVEVQAIKTALVELRENNDLRNLLGYTDIIADLRGLKLDRRTMQLIAETELPKLRHLLPRVMATVDQTDRRLERASPNDIMTLRNGHYRTMLLRYIFAGRAFCDGKQVLDVCCGRGWGTALIAHYARSVHAIDLEDALIRHNEAYWKTENITWNTANALDPNQFIDDEYDTVLGMEIIEHFTREEGEVLFQNIIKGLKPGGYFVGTSAFPNHRKHADNHPALKKDGHKYLWTIGDLSEYLRPHSESVTVVENWMLLFQKKL